jgi:uncharacterized protein (TIGR03083 family)
MAFDYKALFWEETEDLLPLLHQLRDEDWDKDTLCDGWRVRDVVSHMELGHTSSLWFILKENIKFKGDLHRGSRDLSRQWGDEHTPAEIVEIWERELVGNHARRGITRGIPYVDGFLDHAIHNQDIRRPLGLPREIPEHRMLALLEALPTVNSLLFSSRKRVRGLRLEATDVEFVCGEGPLVRGAGEAIMMAAAGRTVALDELEGDGVTVLAERTGGQRVATS